MLHVPLNKPEFNLVNNDIIGSRPNWNKFVSTRVPSNPLEPKYKLASFTYVPPEPPKFVKDPLNIDDIEGSKAIKAKEINPRPTSTQFTDSIEGAQVKGAYVRK